MTRPLSRRHLLAGSLAGIPLLAACTDDKLTLAQLEQAAKASAAADDAGEGVQARTVEPAPAAEAQAAPAEAPPSAVKTVVLDPGHGGDDIGAATTIGGPVLAEKDSNLRFAFRLRELLEADGYRVVMTRESDSRAFGYVRPTGGELSPSGSPVPITLSTSRADLLARVDRANTSKGDLFLSIHSNDTAGDVSENGVEVWYCDDREAGRANGVFAQMMLDDVLGALRGYGYRANNRGIKEDRYFRVRNGRNFHLYVLGPPNAEANKPRATMMPAALVENLFMRHGSDARVLRDPDGREAIAQGMRRAVTRFFEWQGA
jgi:N-acetylmuramoyl-L-alanine amidase